MNFIHYVYRTFEDQDHVHPDTQDSIWEFAELITKVLRWETEDFEGIQLTVYIPWRYRRGDT